MTRFRLIFSSFIHYIKANLLVASGVAISTAVLTGALIIGDSVTFSLEQSTFYRLGNTTHIVSTVDRYFRIELAKELAAKGGFDVAPALILEGMAVSDGGENRINKVQINGIDDSFEKISASPEYLKLINNEVIISENLAEKLHLKTGNTFLARIKKASLIPLNAPFVSDAETSISFHAVVKAIANQQKMGLFNMKNSQTSPYNLFLSLSKLNELMKFDRKANHLLISTTTVDRQKIRDLLQLCFTTEDAGLKIKEIPLTNEREITSERVFIDEQIIKAFTPFRESHPVLTYFANSLEGNHKATPYSFVSTINDNLLQDNDIIINDWVASDLSVKTGDSITLKYFEIGPLRQLLQKETKFIIKQVVPIEGKYADKDLMPYLPGMSDAGNCRDWEAGVPIKLESIRDKDESYWKIYKGTPKAFISLKKAQQIWSNRFGNYTAFRISNSSFSEKEYRSLFATAVTPQNLGVTVTSVLDNGLTAARNGVDFSQLFLGLSFFILAAAIILTGLLTLINFENRQSQMGTLLMLGFTRNQTRRLFLYEGTIVAIAGGLFGLLIAVFYTKMIFIALNSLWWDVVRTSVLEIQIKTSTLLIALVISVFISVITIILSVNRSFKRQVIELQRQQTAKQRPVVTVIKKYALYTSLSFAAGIAGFELIFSGQSSAALFFLSGGLLLTGLLLFAETKYRRSTHFEDDNFSVRILIRRNSSQNISRSLTVIILFALGTFLVVSTGANRQDLLSGADAKTSGTGGFKYFSESSVPVLFSLNDTARRKSEGLTSNFQAAQFSKMDGDDASCLNLNRVSNPSILGADPELLSNRFSFAVIDPQIHQDQIWEALNKTLNNGVIPAIADQTVIQWGLGLSVGDTLRYRNEKGDTLKLKLVAGLSPSVFQGYVLISNTNFLKNFPTTSGSNIFLIDTPKDSEKATGEELQNLFRDYGWEMTTSAKRLMEFNSVTNTYLSIFLALGALGLILGTVGLAVVLARTLLERKKEIAMMQMVGFTRKQIMRLLVSEYSTLLLWGILIGFISAVVAVLPNFLTPGSDVSFLSVLWIVLLILANGILWIVMLSWLGLRKQSLVVNLNQ